MVNAINRLATIPGITNGIITSQNVFQRVWPKSKDASSRLWSKFMNAEDKMAMQKGVQIRIWPKIILQSDSSKPICMMTTNKDTPMMISGNTIGSIINPMMDRRAGNTNRVEARAARTPNNVENRAVVTAIIKLLPTATCKVSLVCNTANHLVVNPFNGKDTMLLSLKAKTGSNIAGA